MLRVSMHLSTTAFDVEIKQEDYIGGETVPQREPK